INQLFHIQHLFTDPDDLSKYPFFVLVPQCPSGRGWHDGHRIPPEAGESDKGDEPIVIAMKILDDTIRQYPIDVDRIYLLGISSGGSAVWELAMRYPERFAAVAPLASGGGNIEDIARLRDVPVWAFHSEFDSGSTVDAVRDTIQTLQLAGGTAHLTTIPSVHHDCWTAALVDYKVVSWMLWQRQGRYCWNRPGPAPWEGWTPWQITFQLGIPMFILAAAWSGWRRKRRRSALRPVPDETTDSDGDEA
ncbi:MAG: PHB depolymerase family esterase, partial [Planctomycetota bacterium]|nr:PHB depolymerase family esterase [Planctomycetota bacterium]